MHAPPSWAGERDVGAEVVQVHELESLRQGRPLLLPRLHPHARRLAPHVVQAACVVDVCGGWGSVRMDGWVGEASIPSIDQSSMMDRSIHHPVGSNPKPKKKCPYSKHRENSFLGGVHACFSFAPFPPPPPPPPPPKPAAW